MIEENNTDSGECIIFDTLLNDLKQKVKKDRDGVDANKIAEVQKKIEELIDTYYERALEDIKALQLAYIQLVNNLDDYEQRLEEVRIITHNMKGQGASFDYHMVTYIGDYLLRFIKMIKSKPTKKILDIIKIHINAMNVILTNKIRGKTDPKGDEVLNGLESTLHKYAPEIVEVIREFRKKEEIIEKELHQKSENDEIAD